MKWSLIMWVRGVGGAGFMSGEGAYIFPIGFLGIMTFSNRVEMSWCQYKYMLKQGHTLFVLGGGSCFLACFEIIIKRHYPA